MHVIKANIFNVTSSAPHGSVLYPSLFLIYINVMVEKVQEDGLYLLADDLKVYMKISSGKETDQLQKRPTEYMIERSTCC